MLELIKISNFAIIDRVEIEFGKGFTVLTGETGAGKSIIVNGINLLLGGRGSSDLIKTGKNEATVEALFLFNNEVMFQEEGFKELLIKRNFSASGKNRIYINNSLSTLGSLEKLTEKVVSLCSQNEHQYLLNPDNFTGILDDFSANSGLKNEYQSFFRRVLDLIKELSELREKLKRKDEAKQLLEFQLREIEEADLKDNEDEILKNEKLLLSNAEKLTALAASAVETIYNEKGSASERVGAALQRLSEASEIDGRLKEAAGLINDAKVSIEEAVFAVNSYLKGISFDEKRLAEVEERFFLISKLKKKYGNSIAEIMDFHLNAKEELNKLSEISFNIEELEKELEKEEKALFEAGAKLTQSRKNGAQLLEKRVLQELSSLNMEKSLFKTVFENYNDPDIDGFEKAIFLLSANPGEEPKLLNRVASGGELSRIMLALKTVISDAYDVQTLIFDEVDSGISGKTAEMLGRKLKELSKNFQVICITHLPQIASFADEHLRVEKDISEGKTSVRIKKLSDNERIKEIARMLSGAKVSDSALKAAKEMIEYVKNRL